jgi:hypothetical protein
MRTDPRGTGSAQGAALGGSPHILKPVRSQVEQAQEHLRNACQMLRQEGWPETADDLMRAHKLLQTWTQPCGWLDLMEAQRG